MSEIFEKFESLLIHIVEGVGVGIGRPRPVERFSDELSTALMGSPTERDDYIG